MPFPQHDYLCFRGAGVRSEISPSGGNYRENWGKMSNSGAKPMPKTQNGPKSAASSSQIALVTGGAGFIGSHMVDLLRDRGFRVRMIDNLVGGREANLAHHAASGLVDLDTRDIRTVEPDDPLFADVVYMFHFAGIGDIVPSIDRPTEYMDVNVMGTVRMLEGARHAKVRKFVYAASSTCYGLAAVPTREDHPIDPKYPYALSKYQGECAAMHWHQVYRLPANSVRIFNAYGTRSRTTGAYGAVFGVFLRQKLAGKPFTVVGDGTQRRDFLYATDVARGFLAAAETSRDGQCYNLGAGNPQSVNRLVELLGGEKTHIPKRPGEPDCTWADITKITTELGWRPEISFEEGVSKIVAQIDYWRDAPLWTPETIQQATSSWFRYLGN
jgi:UDP-glucose 4-epimerase